MHKKKKTTSLYLLLGALAVLAVVGLLISFSSARERERVLQEERATQLQKENEKKDQALANMAIAQNYQPYCKTGVMRIDRSEDILRIMQTAKNAAIRYERDGKMFTCPSVSQKENCDAVTSGNFAAVYTCPVVPVSVAVAGDNGVILKAQPVGNAVVVDRVVFAEPGFVVVYPKSGDQAIAHSSLLPAGTFDIVSIAIPVRLQFGVTYRIQLVTDTGDGVLSETDRPILMDTSKPLSAEFTTIR